MDKPEFIPGRHHVSQLFGIPDGADIDFFDANLEYDSPVFIDPFLLKNSPLEKERLLFDRFGDYFRYAYDSSLELSLGRINKKQMQKILSFHEPKSIGMGYTEASNEGHGPSLKERLLVFFVDHAAKSFIRETKAFPDSKYNPVSLQAFTDGVGPDGVSDITANLIMDYLIEFTQEQCLKWGIPLEKSIALDVDGFDFEIMRWKSGGYYQLPSNPFRPEEPFVLVPKWLLRGLAEHRDNTISKVMSILRHDVELSDKFSDLLDKSIKDIGINEIRNVFKNDKSVHYRYLKVLEAERDKPYDFRKDELSILADKTYENRFDDIELPEIKSCSDLKILVDKLLEEFSLEFSLRDGWKDAWQDSGSGSYTPKSEPTIGRKLRAMGFALFGLFEDITFIPETGTGNGFLDFSVIYNNCRISIELKLLKNNAQKGKDDPIPSYMHGLERQLPHYVKLTKSNHAYYVTGQHYNSKQPRERDDSSRFREIQSKRPEVEKALNKHDPRFKSLTCINVDMSIRPSASNL